MAVWVGAANVCRNGVCIESSLFLLRVYVESRLRWKVIEFGGRALRINE